MSHLAESLGVDGLRRDPALDELDLIAEGLIDSFGIVELMGALEDEFGVDLDFTDLDADALTRIGPLSRFVASRVRPSE